ncbi:uncharacterized protein LOC125625375 isoform X2 [Caretta caretta]
MLPQPAAPPLPALPGRLPGCLGADHHGCHPAPSSPTLCPGLRVLPLRPDAGHDVLCYLLPDGHCLCLRSEPHHPWLESDAHDRSAGGTQVRGEGAALPALCPGLAAPRPHVPGPAAAERHVRERHRSHGRRTRHAPHGQSLPRGLQPVLLQYTGGKDTGLEMKIIFFLSLLLVLSCCTFLYCRVKLWCRRNNEVRLMNMENDGFASRNIQSVCKISRCFQLVFLICWTPAFLLSILSFTSIEPASIFALHVAMALTMSLQGLLHSLVYGWLRQNFRQEALGETLPLRYYPGLKACYEESFGVEC